MPAKKQGVFPLPMTAPVDVKLACALLLYAAQDGIFPTIPIQLSFTSYENDCIFIDEISEHAGWSPKSWKYQRSRLSTIALRLEDYNYLDGFIHVRNECAMENNEPFRWKVYTMPLKYRRRLNPKGWSGPELEYPTLFEMTYMLRRVFAYEGDVFDWIDPHN